MPSLPPNNDRTFHGAGKVFRVVHCICCTQPMHSIYDPAVRDTCHECGGVSKMVPSPDMRDVIAKRYQEQRAKEIAARKKVNKQILGK